MEIETLGIDRSVSVLFPPAELSEKLQDCPVETVVLDESGDSDGTCDGVVTFAYRDAFLETEP